MSLVRDYVGCVFFLELDPFGNVCLGIDPDVNFSALRLGVGWRYLDTGKSLKIARLFEATSTLIIFCVITFFRTSTS